MTIFHTIKYPVIDWHQTTAMWDSLPSKIHRDYLMWHNLETFGEPSFDTDRYREQCLNKVRQLIRDYEE